MLVNIFCIFFVGFKSFLVNGMSDVLPPAVKEQKLFPKILEQKLKELKKSPVARKVDVAKGYYKLEMAPPKANEMEKLRCDINYVKQFFKQGSYKSLTVREAWLLLLVSTEVGLWFFMGETVGKMHLVGYKV